MSGALLVESRGAVEIAMLNLNIDAQSLEAAMAIEDHREALAAFPSFRHPGLRRDDGAT